MRIWLKDLRIAKKLTMKEVATAANISESFYSQIENGNRNPAVEVAKGIATALDFSWTKFFE